MEKVKMPMQSYEYAPTNSRLLLQCTRPASEAKSGRFSTWTPRRALVRFQTKSKYAFEMALLRTKLSKTFAAFGFLHTVDHRSGRISKQSDAESIPLDEDRKCVCSSSYMLFENLTYRQTPLSYDGTSW